MDWQNTRFNSWRKQLWAPEAVRFALVDRTLRSGVTMDACIKKKNKLPERNPEAEFGEVVEVVAGGVSAKFRTHA